MRVEVALHSVMMRINDIIDDETERTGSHPAFISTELFLKGAMSNDIFRKSIEAARGNAETFEATLDVALSSDSRSNTSVTLSHEVDAAFNTASIIAGTRNSPYIHFADVVYLLVSQYEDIRYYLTNAGTDIDKFLEELYLRFEMKAPVIERVRFGGGTAQSQGNQPSFIEQFTVDMLEQAKKMEEPLVGREKELDKTIRIMCRKTKPNVLHVGEPGVGKTTIILGLAKKILANEVPEKLRGSEIYSLDISSVMAGSRFRGDMEERIKGLLNELSKKEKVILYVDEIHNLVGTGQAAGGGVDLAGLFKTALTSSNIRFIGTTTYDEYRKYFEKDKALSRRFKPVDILEPSQGETKEILRGILPYFEKFHSVMYTADAIDAAVSLTTKYVKERFLPDKAIDIIDEAGAMFSKDGISGTVDAAVIEKLISESCRIPIETVSTDDKQKLMTLADTLKKHVFGQDEAIDECVKAIKLARSGLQDAHKPVASLLFVGQTGVGKTEIARQLAAHMGIELIRFDMSEYVDETSANKLIGASAGYVGYDDGGLLVEQVRKNPHAVLLLDEIEKAHPKVFNLLLQVMDNAELTDNKGRKADFTNIILIMTSNAGASGVVSRGLGFGAATKVIDMGNMKRAVEKTFTPEFRNRLTKIITLNSLDDAMADRIIAARMRDLTSLMKSKGIKITYGDKVLGYLKDKGITEEFGARELLRVINSDIKMLFVDGLLVGTIKDGSVVSIRMKNEKPVIVVK